MNFQPELAAKVMAGDKTVTRRIVSDNPRSPWWRDRCKLTVGRDYAVCPGRGKHAIGRVRIRSVKLEGLPTAGLSVSEARREGFDSPQEFMAAWSQINGGWAPVKVWRVEFEVVRA